MRRFVDLHTHSIASDGQLRPAEIVRLAENKRLAAIALTDHDTIDGLAEAQGAAGEFPRLRFLCGIEISARFPQGTLHILGLGIDPASPAIRELTALLQDARNQRNPKIVAALQKLDVKIDMDDVLEQALRGRAKKGGEIVGRLHIAQAMVRNKQVKSTAEAFAKYIGHNGPAFVDKEKLEPRDAIGLIVRAGGVASLAHPPELNFDNHAQFERILRDLVRGGLGAIEAYHTDNSPSQTRLFLDMARKYKLELSGGSDFHGAVKPCAHIGRPPVPLSMCRGLMKKLGIAFDE